MADTPNIDRDLRTLETELRQLEAEYNMYFAGRLPRPPVETRTRVLGHIKRIDRLQITNYAERFRFTTLQTRYQTFVDLWDRGLRNREEGRGGARVAPRPTAATETAPVSERPASPSKSGVHVAAFRDPANEMEKLHELYDRLVDARRQTGEESVPFHKFADLVKAQVKQLRDKGNPEVAFRVAVKDGKVNFTAKGSKGTGSEDR